MENIGDFFARVTADTKQFDRSISNSVKVVADLETHTKKMVSGLASLTTAFGNVGGEAGKTLTTVGQLASGLAAGGPLGLAVAGISLAFGKWLEKTKALNDELASLSKLSTNYDDALRSAQLAAMRDRDMAETLAIEDRLFRRREEVQERYNKLINDSLEQQNQLTQSLKSYSGSSVYAYNYLKETLEKQRKNTEQLINARDIEIAKIVEIANLEKKAIENKRAEEQEREREKAHLKWIADNRARELEIAKALQKIQKDMADEEARLAKLREAAINRMRTLAPRPVSSADAPQATITPTGPNGIGEAGQYIGDRISAGVPFYGETKAFANLFNINLDQVMGQMGTAIASAIPKLVKAAAGAIAAAASSPAVLAIIAGAGVAVMWASIPVVIAQWAALLFAPITVPLAALAGALTLAVGGLLYFGNSTTAAAEVQDRLKGAWETFKENAFSPIYDAILPLIKILETFALRLGQAFGSVVNFRIASEMAFDATKGFAIMLVDGAIMVGTALEMFANGIIAVYNGALLPIIKTFNPGALPINPFTAPGMGFLEMLRGDLEDLAYIDAIYDNTEATRENTRIMERIHNVPTGYRLKGSIWQAQLPATPTNYAPIGTVSGTVGGNAWGLGTWGASFGGI